VSFIWMKKIFSAIGGSASGGKYKILKLILKLLVSAFFIWIVISKINWSESWQYLKRIEVWQILVYLAVIFLGLLISARKWQGLCRFKGLKNSFFDLFKLYLTGAFINNFVPSTIGGDIFRAYQVGKKEKRYLEASSTVVMDRFTGLLALMIMSPVFFLLNFQKISGIHIFIFSNLIILGALASMFIFLKTKETALVKKIFGYFPKKAINFLRELASFGSNWKVFIKTMVYSLLFNLIGVGLANLVLFWSLGIKINFLDYFSAIFVISIVSSIPAGIGFKEWSYIAFFAPLGINISAVIMVAFLNRFLQGLVNIAAFPVYLRDRIKKTDIKL